MNLQEIEKKLFYQFLFGDLKIEKAIVAKKKKKLPIIMIFDLNSNLNLNEYSDSCIQIQTNAYALETHLNDFGLLLSSLVLNYYHLLY